MLLRLIILRVVGYCSCGKIGKHLSLLQPKLLGRVDRCRARSSPAGRLMQKPLSWESLHLGYSLLRDLLAAGRSKDSSCRCVCHFATPVGECTSLEGLLRDQLAKPVVCPAAAPAGAEDRVSWSFIVILLLTAFAFGTGFGVYLAHVWSVPREEQATGGRAITNEGDGERRRGGVFLDAMRLEGAGEVRRAW